MIWVGITKAVPLGNGGKHRSVTALGFYCSVVCIVGELKKKSEQ